MSSSHISHRQRRSATAGRRVCTRALQAPPWPACHWARVSCSALGLRPRQQPRMANDHAGPMHAASWGARWPATPSRTRLEPTGHNCQWWCNCTRRVAVRPSRGPGTRLPRGDPNRRGLRAEWQVRYPSLGGATGATPGPTDHHAARHPSVVGRVASLHWIVRCWMDMRRVYTYRGRMRRARAPRSCLVHSWPSQQPWCTRRST